MRHQGATGDVDSGVADGGPRCPLSVAIIPI